MNHKPRASVPPDGSTPAQPHASLGALFYLDTPDGRIACYHAEPQVQSPQPPSPVILVHSINAAPSAHEMASLHERLSSDRPVYSVELPGFGHADRADLAYSPRIMTDALHALQALVASRHGGRSADGVALSLSCEFLARAALERPQGWRSLALISPTGFNGLKRRRGAPGTTLGMPGLYRALTVGLWSQGLYRVLTSERSIRFFLRKTWGSRDLDERLVEQAVKTTRMPGARHAPLRFLSGFLFSADINDVYEALTQPVWMTHGTRGDFVDYRGKDTVISRPNWTVETWEGGAMPHWEQADAFAARYRSFLEALAPQG